MQTTTRSRRYVTGTGILLTLAIAATVWGLDGQWRTLTGYHLHETAIWLYSWMIRPEGMLMIGSLVFAHFIVWFAASPRRRLASMTVVIRRQADAIDKDQGEHLRRHALYRP